MTPASSSTWRAAARAIEAKVNTHVYRTYFLPIHCVSETEEELALALPSKFIRDWVHDNYLDFLRREVEQVCGRPLSLRFVVVEPRAHAAAHSTVDGVAAKASPLAPGEASQRPPQASDQAHTRYAPPDTSAHGASDHSPHSARFGPSVRHLNDRYSFDSFVCGSSNQFAYAACKAVADVPATNYNPLFIFGGVGLGKTHLLNAIGLSIKERHPDWNILLLSAENFTNEVIISIRENRMVQLRQKFRERCDVLLMDDIQFLAGKDRTQEEFFHTFNSLHETHRQIVVTSDKLPAQIPELEERLSSRFQWGLIADIQPPELETRVAILEKKALADQIALPSDVAMFLATHIKSNVRELEGSLIRIEAFASLTGQEISIELAAEVLKDILSLKGRTPDAESILQTVASYYNVRVSELRSHRRHKQIARPRQVAMYLTRELTDLSFPDIGKCFGGKDHSTVMSACKKIGRLLDEDLALRQTVGSLQKSITA